MQLVKSIITSILTALYQLFWYAVWYIWLLFFIKLYEYHSIKPGTGLRVAVKAWGEEFKTKLFYNKLFILFFITVMILFRTLSNLILLGNPLSDFTSGWWIGEC